MTNEAFLLVGGDYQEVPDAESMTKGKTLMVEPLTPLDAKVLFSSIADSVFSVGTIRMAYKKKKSDKVYPAFYYHATGFMVAISLSKLLDLKRFISLQGEKIVQDDIEWAIKVTGDRPVLFTTIEGFLGIAIWLQVTKDEEEWFHVRVGSSNRLRYFRCDQHKGLKDLIKDLPVLFSHEK